MYILRVIIVKCYVANK